MAGESWVLAVHPTSSILALPLCCYSTPESNNSPENLESFLYSLIGNIQPSGNAECGLEKCPAVAVG